MTDLIETYSTSPHRTPLVVADQIKDLIKNKIVCELGCGEGDNMLAMSKHAKKVFGIEIDPDRYKFAQQRGFDISVLDYRQEDLPIADVYYFWPDNGARDNDFLIKKILSNENFHGTIIVGADKGHQQNTEKYNIKKKPLECHESYVLNQVCEKYNGKIREIEFNEGEGYRQSGIFMVGIINKKQQ